MNKVCVFGMYHLGAVTACCLADLGFQVSCLDLNSKIINDFKNDQLPIYEPGVLEKILKNRLSMSFHISPETALKDCDFLWIAFDISVDEKDEADIAKFIKDITNIFQFIPDQCKVIISSQVRIGTTTLLQENFNSMFPDKKVYFGYSPENLRLGNSIQNFINPDRIVMGIKDDSYKKLYAPLLSSITNNIIWMQTESAEMVKHTINSFLATCIVFSNEIGSICELNNINYEEVEAGFRSESRVGTQLPLKAGLGFAGGTLARDVNYLNKYSENNYLINSLFKSNTRHNTWVMNAFLDLKNTNLNVGVVGLAYKPNTSTLRRSLALDLCLWLKDKSKNVFFYDDNINNESLFELLQLQSSNDLVLQSDCIFVFSKKLDLNTNFENKIIIDPNGLYTDFFKNYNKCKYIRVGKI